MHKFPCPNPSCEEGKTTRILVYNLPPPNLRKDGDEIFQETKKVVEKCCRCGGTGKIIRYSPIETKETTVVENG